MPIVPRAIIDQNRIKAAVQAAERSLTPDVIRILHTFAEDVQGDISLFFRVVISDQAAAPARLRETTKRIKSAVLDEVRADDLGLQTYFNFRSQSEQATLRDPFWERQ